MVYCKESRGVFDRGKTVFKNPHVNLIEKELEYFINCLSREVKPLDFVERSIKILEIIEEVRRQPRRKN